MKRGDVVLAVLTGEMGKPRPAVVVQSDRLQDTTSTVIICPITSDLARGLPLRPSITPTEANGLVLESQIMTDKIVAAPHNRIRRVIGSLEPATMARLDEALLMVLNLTH